MYQKQARYLYDDTGINLPHNKQGWIQGIQELWYSQRKQTVERLFETAKENHSFRVYAGVWESPDGNESGAYVYMPEFKETGASQSFTAAI